MVEDGELAVECGGGVEVGEVAEGVGGEVGGGLGLGEVGHDRGCAVEEGGVEQYAELEPVSIDSQGNVSCQWEGRAELTWLKRR